VNFQPDVGYINVLPVKYSPKTPVDPNPIVPPNTSYTGKRFSIKKDYKWTNKKAWSSTAENVIKKQLHTHLGIDLFGY